MSLVFKSEFHSVVSAADDICSDMLLTYVGHKVEKKFAYLCFGIYIINNDENNSCMNMR